jgi:hypothetical protein
MCRLNGDIPGPGLDRTPGSEPDHIPGPAPAAIAPQHAVVVPDIPDALIDVSESAVWDIGLMYLAKLEQRSSGEASIERDVIGFGEPDEREE